MRRGGRERCHAPARSAKQVLVRSPRPGVRQPSANAIAIPCAKDLRSNLVRYGLFRKRADQTARKLTSLEGRRTCKGKGVARVDVGRQRRDRGRGREQRLAHKGAAPSVTGA